MFKSPIFKLALALVCFLVDNTIQLILVSLFFFKKYWYKNMFFKSLYVVMLFHMNGNFFSIQIRHLHHSDGWNSRSGLQNSISCLEWCKIHSLKFLKRVLNKNVYVQHMIYLSTENRQYFNLWVNSDLNGLKIRIFVINWR